MSDDPVMELKPPRGKSASGSNRKALSQRITSSIAAAARSGASADLIVEYWLTIAQGHGEARLSEDKKTITCTCAALGGKEGRGHRDSTPEQIAWAFTQLRQAGYGMPVQTHILEAEMRSQGALDASSPAVSNLSLATVIGIRRLLEKQAEDRAALASASAPAQVTDDLASVDDAANAIDAEFTESASASDEK